MTLRSLKILVTVVETGKMTTAANQLFIAQPTISQTIIELEKEYNIQIFDRLNKKLYLTNEGHLFYQYAKRILALTNEMNDEIKNLSNKKKIYMGATLTVGKSVLIDLVKHFEQEYPNIEIIVKIDNTRVIENLLLESKVDIAFVEGVIRNTELISTPVVSDELVLACSTFHEIAKRDSITLEELSKYPFILREEGSGTRELFESILHKNSIEINVKWNSHGFDSIIDATVANQGLTVISKRLVMGKVKSGDLCIVPIQDVNLKRNFSLVTHKTKYIGKSLQDIIGYIKNYNYQQ